MRAILPFVVVVATLTQACADRRPEEAATAANLADRAFVDAMIGHHQTTILLARLAETRGATRPLRRLGTRIVAMRSSELEVLNAQEEAMDIAGVPRAARAPVGTTEDPAGGRRELARLRNADTFDAAFVKAMARHEQHDVEMSRLVLERGRDVNVKRTARRVLRDRQAQLRAMRRVAGGA